VVTRLETIRPISVGVDQVLLDMAASGELARATAEALPPFEPVRVEGRSVSDDIAAARGDRL